MEAASFPQDSLGRGGAGDDAGAAGSCPGTPEMRRRQEEVLRRLAGQVGSLHVCPDLLCTPETGFRVRELLTEKAFYKLQSAVTVPHHKNR